MKLNVQGHLKCWLWRLVSLLWAEHKYNRFKEGLENVNDDASPGEPMKTLKQWRKWFWIIVELLLDNIGISFGSCQAIFTNVLGMKHAAVKFVAKLQFAETTLLNRCWRR